MKKQLIEHHRAMINSKELWINTKISDLDKIENEIFN